MVKIEKIFVNYREILVACGLILASFIPILSEIGLKEARPAEAAFFGRILLWFVSGLLLLCGLCSFGESVHISWDSATGNLRISRRWLVFGRGARVVALARERMVRLTLQRMGGAEGALFSGVRPTAVLLDGTRVPLLEEYAYESWIGTGSQVRAFHLELCEAMHLPPTFELVEKEKPLTQREKARLKEE